MTYDEAMKLAKSGKTVARPHWHWIGVKLHCGKLRIVDENGSAGSIYRPLADEQTATDWDVRK